MKIFPPIETERLILDRIIESDLEDFVLQINSAEDFSKNLFNIPYPFPPKNAITWLEHCNLGIESGESLRFAVRKKEVGKLIGVIGLHLDQEHQKAELGYWLGKSFWGNGYLTEGLVSILNYGFKDLELNKIAATHFIFNPGSGRVMQKAGMKLEGLQKQEYFHHGQFLDVNRYSILKEDFEFL